MNFGIGKEGVSDKTVKSDGINVLEISHLAVLWISVKSQEGIQSLSHANKIRLSLSKAMEWQKNPDEVL